MNRVVCALAALALAAGCTRSSAAPRRQPKSPTVIQTIDSGDMRPMVIQPPPVLTDEGPAPKPKGDVMSPDAPPPPTPQDEALRAALPFAPAIGLDPVSGMKISIRANTPTYEYKGHVFYFASVDTRKTFVASPDQYTKGVFAH